jgi:hypothetical protein
MTPPPALPPEPPRRTRALLLLLFVFLLGAASGIGGGLLLLRGLAHRAWAGDMGENSPVELVTQSMERQISAELELTAEERRAIQKELAVTVMRFREMRLRLRADSRAIVEDSLTRLEQHLPPEKRARLRERAGQRLRPWGLMP